MKNITTFLDIAPWMHKHLRNVGKLPEDYKAQ
jgi:hypothetical protein